MIKELNDSIKMLHQSIEEQDKEIEIGFIIIIIIVIIIMANIVIIVIVIVIIIITNVIMNILSLSL